MDDDIRLRPVVEDDLPHLRRFELEPEALGELEWSGWRDPRHWERRWEKGDLLTDHRGTLIVTGVDGATIAGFVGWHERSHGANRHGGCWNIGIALLPEHRGRGIGTRAQVLLVEYLFATTRVVRIEAETMADNHAEQRALDKAAFTREGVVRSGAWQHGGWHDVVLYSRLRGDPAPSP